ncbi:MAG: hypothetical protein JWL58_2183 [Streptosporangiaceae bacterium]|nr:hypothetical protein [Streptosporangiaceae bacterium]
MGGGGLEAAAKRLKRGIVLGQGALGITRDLDDDMRGDLADEIITVAEMVVEGGVADIRAPGDLIKRRLGPIHDEDGASRGQDALMVTGRVRPPARSHILPGERRRRRVRAANRTAHIDTPAPPKTVSQNRGAVPVSPDTRLNSERLHLNPQENVMHVSVRRDQTRSTGR